MKISVRALSLALSKKPAKLLFLSKTISISNYYINGHQVRPQNFNRNPKQTQFMFNEH